MLFRGLSRFAGLFVALALVPLATAAPNHDVATAQTIGEASPGTNGPPTISHLGLPEILGPFPRIVIDDGLSNARAIIILGFDTQPVFLPRFDATLFPEVVEIIPLTLDSSGRGVLDINPPGFFLDPAVSGLLVVAQGLVRDAGAMGRLAFTSGIELRVGERPRGDLYGGQRFEALAAPAGAVLADFDEDGNLDYVIADNQGDQVVVHLGDGEGNFSPGFTGPAGPFPQEILQADLNQDGDIDLVVPNSFSSGTISTLLGNGDGTFDPPVSLSAQFTTPLEVADVSSDGIPDLITTRQIGPNDRLSIRLGTGTGTFSSEVTFPLAFIADNLTAGDVNSDGDTDIVVGSTGSNNLISVYLGDGAGNFTTTSMSPFFSGGAGVNDLILADLDGDNQVDLVASHFSEEVSVHLGDGTGGFGTPIVTFNGPNGVGDLGAGDFNGDGMADLVGASFTNDGITLFTGLGDGNFDSELVSAASSDATFVVSVGDVNNDLQDDLISLNFADDFVVHLGNGTDSFFGTARVFPSAPGTVDVISADFTGDGAVDLMTANFSGGVVSLLEGNGIGGFADPVDFGAGIVNPATLASGDFDSDGNVDVVVTDLTGNNVGLLLNPGDGSFGSAVSFPAGTAPFRVAAGDLDNDGNLDVVTLSDQLNQIAVLLGDGTGGFAAPNLINAASTPRDLALGRLNEDEFLDIVVASDGDDAAVVLLGLGNGQFGAPTLFPSAGSGPESVAMGDANGDGALDIAVGHFFSNTTVLFGVGDGTFGPAVVLGSLRCRTVTFQDLDGDGYDDVASLAVSGFRGMATELSNGDGTFATRQDFAVANGVNALFAVEGVSTSHALGDVNSDGRPDLIATIIAQEFNGGVSVGLNQLPNE